MPDDGDIPPHAGGPVSVVLLLVCTYLAMTVICGVLVWAIEAAVR